MWSRFFRYRCRLPSRLFPPTYLVHRSEHRVINSLEKHRNITFTGDWKFGDEKMQYLQYLEYHYCERKHRLLEWFLFASASSRKNRNYPSCDFNWSTIFITEYTEYIFELSLNFKEIFVVVLRVISSVRKFDFVEFISRYRILREILLFTLCVILDERKFSSGGALSKLKHSTTAKCNGVAHGMA